MSHDLLSPNRIFTPGNYVNGGRVVANDARKQINQINNSSKQKEINKITSRLRKPAFISRLYICMWRARARTVPAGAEWWTFEKCVCRLGARVNMCKYDGVCHYGPWSLYTPRLRRNEPVRTTRPSTYGSFFPSRHSGGEGVCTFCVLRGDFI